MVALAHDPEDGGTGDDQGRTGRPCRGADNRWLRPGRKQLDDLGLNRHCGFGAGYAGAGLERLSSQDARCDRFGSSGVDNGMGHPSSTVQCGRVLAL